ncbi:hypothetical protein GCK32_006713, partial [Trichostrongylus colubriformis]
MLLQLLALLTCTCVISGQAVGGEQETIGKSSLAFVFDTTGSMFDDLLQFREGAKKIFQTVMQQRDKLIHNFIMVPFHDPNLGEIIDTTDAKFFIGQLAKVYVHGGGDCPEMTLTGIQKALEISLPSSFIYVFTDARSKDYDLENAVLNMIQEKQSSVVFVMTGDCGNRTHPGFQVYEKIAAASFGQVFHLEKSDVSAVLEYVRHSVKQKKIHVLYEIREHGGEMQRTVPIDGHMTELTISLSGDKDDTDALDIILRDPKGRTLSKNVLSQEGGTIDLQNVKLIRIIKPQPGPWQVTTNSRVKHTIRIFGHGSIDFKYGFATRLLERFELAHPRPVANQNSYVLVNMMGLDRPGMVNKIALLDYFGSTIDIFNATLRRGTDQMYFAGPFVPPKDLFFVQIIGQDQSGHKFQRITPTAIGSVTVSGPRAYMSPTTSAIATMSANLTCVVESSSPFTLSWKKGNRTMGGPLFYRLSETSVWSIPEVTVMDRGEYHCVVMSDSGNHSANTFLDVKESPPLFIGRTVFSASLGRPAFLHCQTQSLSKVGIRWLRYNLTVLNGTNTMIHPNGTLQIFQASQADAGSYECRAQNKVKRYLKHKLTKYQQLQYVTSILEMPKVFVSPRVIYFVPGLKFTISCHADGDPPPRSQWFHNGSRLYPNHNYYISFKNELIARDPSPNDAGVYECQASSVAGVNADTATAFVAVPPRVELKQTKSLVKKGDRVFFECIVLEAAPPPEVRWFKDGKEVLRSGNVLTNGTHLEIAAVYESDAGSYSCVVDNIAGRGISVVKLAVGSMPKIISPPETVQVDFGEEIMLQCNAVGHPPPTITWQRNGIPIDSLNYSRYALFPDGRLLIRNAQLEDQTTFTCIAQNEYGLQSKTTPVVISGLVSPVLGHIPPEQQLIEGEDLRLSCVVVHGTPRPEIKWFRDGVLIKTSPSLL